MKIFFVFIIAFGLTSAVKAQSCNFFPMSKGKTLGYQNLNARGKVTSKSRTSCYDMSTDSNGVIMYKLKTEISNAKDVQLASREYKMKCDQGKMSVDTESYADPNAIKGFQEMTIGVNNNDVAYPEELSVGLALPDAIITMQASAEGKSKNTYVIIITERTIVSNESITVPVGTFDCFKITYDLELKTTTSNTFKVIEYLAEGVGKIKTETYNHKGKLTSSSVLVELNQ